ncbi:TIGR02186 family protein [Paracoccus endophyticus]|uniref:TIGR02186 family protein n=1 Tax=Paracoccus endophyticus TaxID=2233774 RepID=UPI001F0C5E22|nr:TIGR02186 family protein [Paracoccus endophyticus]
MTGPDAPARGPWRGAARLALVAALAGAAPAMAQDGASPAAGAQAADTPVPPGPTRTTIPAPRPPAEEVVAGLSQDDVAITTSFDGSQILIYGAVKRQTPIPAGPGLGVIVTVEGPSQPVTVRRKERRAGIWINAEQLEIGAAPDFYVVATSAPLDTLLTPESDTQYRISPALAVRSFAGPVEIEDATAFTEALLRLRTEQGRYRVDEGTVRVVEETLFRADVTLPSNLIEGTYKARILLVRGGRVVDVHRAPIEVRKVGLELWLYRLSLEQPFWYGLMSLAIAMVAGWAASTAFRALRRT